MLFPNHDLPCQSVFDKKEDSDNRTGCRIGRQINLKKPFADSDSIWSTVSDRDVSFCLVRSSLLKSSDATCWSVAGLCSGSSVEIAKI